MPAGPPLPAWLTRVGVFDLETTGVDVESDRVVTAYVGILDADGRQVAARSWLADPGVPIPDGATAVHGITTAHARAHGRPVPEVVAEVTAALRSLFRQGVPVVAYNASFDFSLLACEAARHGVDPLTDPAPVIDPLVIDKAYDRYRRGRRTLEVVAAHYAVPLRAPTKRLRMRSPPGAWRRRSPVSSVSPRIRYSSTRTRSAGPALRQPTSPSTS